MVLSPLKLGASLIKVFLFHKQNTCGNSLYIVTMYIFVTSFPIYGSTCRDTILKWNPQNKETMLSTTLGFPICRRVRPLFYFGSEDHRFFLRVSGTMSSLTISPFWCWRPWVLPKICWHDFITSRKKILK